MSFLALSVVGLLFVAGWAYIGYGLGGLISDWLDERWPDA